MTNQSRRSFLLLTATAIGATAFAADALVEVSRSVDLLILGERHRRLVLGGPVRAVLAHAHCPVGLIR